MFKFTIREAILMTTIVAVLLMWWLERSQNAKYESRLTALETHFRAIFPPLPRGVTVGTTIPPPPTVSFTVVPPTSGTFVPVQPTTTQPAPTVPSN